jgi:hypothetical protein
MKGREFLPADVVGLLVTNGNPALAWAREAVWPVHEVGLQETITLHRHLRRMLDPAILLLIAAISLGLALARFAGLFGLPLALILISWFFKYAYALLDDVAHGVDEAPVLSMEMVNPLAQRPAAQLAICLGAWALTHWTDGGVRVAFIALLALTLPASVAILGASGKVLQAVNPLALWTVMRALGAYYAGVLALIGVGGLLAWWILALPVWLVFKLAVVQFVVLAIFNAIGAALYEHREQLDLEVLRSPERSQQRSEGERARDRARMLDEIYALVRVRKYAEASATLKPWLDAASRDELRVDAAEILQRAMSWNDRQALATIASLCIGRLHDERLIGEALDAWERALNQDPSFRLAPAEKAAALGELSSLAGRRALARKIAHYNSTATEADHPDV